MGINKNFMRKIKKALISTSDKTNLIQLLKVLRKFNIKLISSGGTYKEIRRLGFKCTEISEYTNFPEILDGRVKTLHPKIHAGILSKRKNKSHQKEMKLNKFDEIDLVIVNFYPFEKTLKSTKNFERIIENIDIGGPAMTRSAAKNFNYVTVISNLRRYNDLIKELNNNKGSTSLSFRQKMSIEAFAETGHYDSIITNFLNKRDNINFPKIKLLSGKLIDKLRYGENPHQEGAIYSNNNGHEFHQLGGKQLSYNNYNDVFSALKIAESLPKDVGTVIVKHTNPCGVSIIKDKLMSFNEAFNCDPISAFGGIISCNFKLNEKTAIKINEKFFEVVAAKGFDPDALKILQKKKNLRIIDSRNVNLNYFQNFTSNLNSILIQTPDIEKFKLKDFKVVSKKKPSSKVLKNLIFAFNVCRFVKSNAIVLVKNKSTVGIGSGQSSRLDSCEIAINKMNKFSNKNSEKILAASDAFFPFVDGIESLVQAGVSAIIQPSGSIRDKEIVKFANQTETILVFSKSRHFNH